MGITNFSVSLLERVVKDFRPSTVIELGSQNLYTTNEPNPPFADVWYNANGFIDYKCIDLAGDNDAFKVDLSQPIVLPNPPFTPRLDGRYLSKEYGLVTDFGSSEHVVQMDGYHTTAFHDGHIHSVYPIDVKDAEAGYYNCWRNKFNLCRVGGIIVSENPKHENWPLHGFHYLVQDFYIGLCKMADLEIIELGENAASGNDVNGWNIHSMLRRTGDKFPSQEDFWSLPIYKD